MGGNKNGKAPRSPRTSDKKFSPAKRRTRDVIALGDWSQFGVYLALIAAVEFVATAGDIFSLFTRANWSLVALIVVVTLSIVLRRRLAATDHATAFDWIFLGFIVLGIGSSGFGIYQSVQANEPASSQEIQVLTKGNVSLPNATIDGQSFANSKMQYSDFRNAHLANVDLSGADLMQSDFRGATLRQVNLSGANLCGADIRGTDLSSSVGLSQVRRWDYAIYDSNTKFPVDVDIATLAGPIKTNRSNVLISCEPGQTRLLMLSGSN